MIGLKIKGKLPEETAWSSNPTKVKSTMLCLLLIMETDRVVRIAAEITMSKETPLPTNKPLGKA